MYSNNIKFSSVYDNFRCLYKTSGNLLKAQRNCKDSNNMILMNLPLLLPDEINKNERLWLKESERKVQPQREKERAWN